MLTLETPLSVIPGYANLKLVARGGMGQVYRADHQGRQVALKILSGSERRRFVKEYEVLSRLHHPGLVQVYQTGEVEGQLFYSMEWVEGLDLLTHVQLFPETLSPLFVKLLEALDYIHSQGVVHRDIKPENMIVQPDGNLKLIDFGLARDLEALHLTVDGTVMAQFSDWRTPE